MCLALRRGLLLFCVHCVNCPTPPTSALFSSWQAVKTNLHSGMNEARRAHRGPSLTKQGRASPMLTSRIDHDATLTPRER